MRKRENVGGGEESLAWLGERTDWLSTRIEA
jgi:hypothetical protein